MISNQSSTKVIPTERIFPAKLTCARMILAQNRASESFKLSLGDFCEIIK